MAKLFRADMHIQVDEFTFKLVEALSQATGKARNQLVNEFIHDSALRSYPEIYKQINTNQRIRLSLSPDEKQKIHISSPIGFTNEPKLSPESSPGVDIITKPPEPIVEVDEPSNDPAHDMLVRGGFIINK